MQPASKSSNVVELRPRATAAERRAILHRRLAGVRAAQADAKAIGNQRRAAELRTVEVELRLALLFS